MRAERPLTDSHEIASMLNHEYPVFASHPNWYDYIHHVELSRDPDSPETFCKPLATWPGTTLQAEGFQGRGTLTDGGGQFVHYEADTRWRLEQAPEGDIYLHLAIKEYGEDDDQVPGPPLVRRVRVEFFQSSYVFFDGYSDSRFRYRMKAYSSPFPDEASKASMNNLYTLLDNSQRITNPTQFDESFFAM